MKTKREEQKEEMGTEDGERKSNQFGWREREKERKRDSQLRTLDREKFQARIS